ncbi:MAG TPA: ATP-binding protein [Desulfobacteraceae bacterium]|nr:ATP-binding protein [Desulfobacteraceae bacterium]HPQ27469.1 ATP-binding protein [Desulfobacteraceae bacterium]
MKNIYKKSLAGIPPWLIIGSVVILAPIFLFWTIQNINKQKEEMIHLLFEKGAALIRSFEAGTRTGMMGMHGAGGRGFQLQRLLAETAQQPDIVHLIVTDINGRIIAHSDPLKIGEIYGKDIDIESALKAEKPLWRQVKNQEGLSETFEVYRKFSPTRIFSRGGRRMLNERGMDTGIKKPENTIADPDQIIFVGMDMSALQKARQEDMHHTILMGAILLLIGFGGIVSLFLSQAYRSTRASLTRIKAFSDNIVENMPMGLIAVEKDGTIVSLNQAAESVLRISSGDIPGKKAEEVLRPLWSIAEDLKGEKIIIEKEINYPLPEGRTVPLDVISSSIEGDDNTSWGYIILFRDLTEIKSLKDEIERSKRLASLGRLAAGVAHEIRNPLSSIKGFATYFRDRYRENKEDQATANIMIQEVDRLNRVIGQLLEFARPMSIHMVPTSIQSTVRHSLKMVNKQASEKNIIVVNNLPHQTIEIPMDPDRFAQVFINLFLNAIEAMEEGGTLSIDLSRDEKAGIVMISVTDTGKGIEKEILEHIFDPYFTTRQSGTGLGLAIVHRIVESHNGEIKVDSDVGKGTRFTVLLPAGK